jgi:ERF superfamily
MQNILKVLILAKQEFKHIPKNSYNPYHKSKYANLDAVLGAISEALNKYDLCLLQPTEVRAEQTILKTVIYHVESGEQIACELLLPQNADPQKTGSAITYYRRYALCSLLGIIADEDDDGNATITQKNNGVGTTFVPNHTTNSSDRANSINTSQNSQQSTPQNIPYNDGEQKARTIYTEMKKVNLSREAVLQIALTKFNSTNIRSFSWEQISQLKTYIKIESNKSQPHRETIV